MSSYIRYGVPRPSNPFTRAAPRVLKPATVPAAPSDDTPVKPVVIRAIELPWALPTVFIQKHPVGAAAVTAGDLPPVSVVAHGVELITQGRTWINRTPAAAVVAVVDAPQRPLVVNAQPLPQQPPAIFVERQLVGADRPLQPVVVTAQPLPPAAASLTVWRPSVEPPAPPPSVFIPPTVVGAQPLPPAKGTASVDWVVLREEQPRPIRPVVVTAQPMPQATQAPIIGRKQAEPPAVSPHPLVTPTVVVAQPLPPAKGAASVDWVVLREEPPRPIRSVVVAAQPLPEAPGRAFVNRPATPPPPVLPQTPRPPTVVNAQPLPQHQQRPYSFIQFTWQENAGSVVPTIAGGASLVPGGQIFTHQVPTPPPPPAPQVPIRSLVVGAQSLPQQVQAPFWYQVKSEPPAAASQVSVRPVVVGAQPLPLQAQAPFRYHVRAEPAAAAAPQPPTKSLVVGAQPLPQQVQAPYWYQPRVEADVPPKPIVISQQSRPLDIQAPFVVKTWGPPPPVLRRPATPIVFDVSRPPLPHGSAIIRKGFAVAIPVFGRGIAGQGHAGTGVSGTSGSGTGNAGNVLIAHGIPSSIG